MKDAEPEDDAAVLTHFSDTLREMATSIVGLEEGYFQALYEVIIKTEKALRDMSRIDTHYVSHVINCDDFMAGGSPGCSQPHGGCRHHHLPRTLRGHAEGDPRVREKGDKSP